jgi:tyrosinase
VQCPHREDAGFFTPTSTVTMRNGELGVNPMQANQPGQDLYQFFVGLPSKYYQLSDITQLGRGMNYSYSVSGLVGQMASQCDAAKGTTRRMLRQQQRANRQDETHHVECKSDLAGGAPGQGSKPVSPPGLLHDHANDNDPDATKVTMWVDEVRLLLRGTPPTHMLDETQIAQQLEKMVCMFYDTCRGGVQDYTEEFKKAFKVNEPPPCKRIVDALRSDATPASERIHLPNWKQLMEQYFPCEVHGEAAEASGANQDLGS